MLKGWNRKVRITKAIRRAWMMTRIVSPKPLSDFVPDVTLIAFPIPSGSPRTAADHFPVANRLIRAKETVVVLLSESASRRKPEFAPLIDLTCCVLDGCSQPRNQWSHQNFLII
jgi:hypothetical protein